MTNKEKVKILIETDLYKYIENIKDLYTGDEAEKYIKEFTEKFKETVSKKHPVENIDELIKNTLNQVNNREKEIAD